MLVHSILLIGVYSMRSHGTLDSQYVPLDEHLAGARIEELLEEKQSAKFFNVVPRGRDLGLADPIRSGLVGRGYLTRWLVLAALVMTRCPVGGID